MEGQLEINRGNGKARGKLTRKRRLGKLLKMERSKKFIDLGKWPGGYGKGLECMGM